MNTAATDDEMDPPSSAALLGGSTGALIAAVLTGRSVSVGEQRSSVAVPKTRRSSALRAPTRLAAQL